MKTRPKILITNDDGIHAPGIYHLWKALHGKADLFIVAPASQQSGVSLSLTLHRPITIDPIQWQENTPAWKVAGTPADCVRFGLRLLLEHKPDIVVSGINRGANSGRNVLYSGTIGGAIEATFRNVPGIAFSSYNEEHPNFEAIEPYIFPIVQYVLEHNLEAGNMLNVNFPTHCKPPFQGVKMARQGKSMIVEKPDRRVHPDGAPYFWHGGQWAHSEEHEESDIALLEQGYVTAVPIHVNELTSHSLLAQRRTLFEETINSLVSDTIR